MSQGLFIVYMQVPIIKSFECACRSCPQVNFESCWDYSHCSYYIPYHCQSISLLSCTSYPYIFNSCYYSWSYRQSLFCFKATNRPISLIDISKPMITLTTAICFSLQKYRDLFKLQLYSRVRCTLRQQHSYLVSQLHYLYISPFIHLTTYKYLISQ